MSKPLSLELESILAQSFAACGKFDDVDICQRVASFLFHEKGISSLYMSYEHVYCEVMDFINEYGEEKLEQYMGRDEYHEKIYVCYNQHTNWEDMIQGYLQRYQKQAA